MFGEGKIIEQDLLGGTKKEKLKFGQMYELETEYLGYRPAVEYVKLHQRGDPHNPTRFFPKSLCDELKNSPELGIQSGEQLAYYTALGSALDRFHGIDAFFEYQSEEGKMVRVTIDVTTNPKKDRYKADVILLIPSEGLDSSDSNYKILVEKYGKQIRDALLTKLR